MILLPKMRLTCAQSRAFRFWFSYTLISSSQLTKSFERQGRKTKKVRARATVIGSQRFDRGETDRGGGDTLPGIVFFAFCPDFFLAITAAFKSCSAQTLVLGSPLA